MADAAPAAGTPAAFLRSIKGRPVSVRLNSGVDYRGTLVCLDGYMNIAMEQTEVRAEVDRRQQCSPRSCGPPDVMYSPLTPQEYVNGVLKNKYGDTFIRGNNVLYSARRARRATAPSLTAARSLRAQGEAGGVGWRGTASILSPSLSLVAVVAA